MIRRHFLGWDRPGLHAAVDWLGERHARDGILDLGGITIVVPGNRAGRRLLELLVARADERGAQLTPPRIITVGHLPEELYEPVRPLAGDLGSLLLWTEVLRKAPGSVLRRLVSDPPEQDDFASWFSLAEMFFRLHRELAGEALSMGDVAAQGESLEGFDDGERWNILADLQKSYLEEVDAIGRVDRDRARLDASSHGGCRSSRDIYLLATVDLGKVQRSMLDRLGSTVTALIFAPESLADHFDDHGCVDSASWEGRTIDLEAGKIERVQRPADQAAAVVRTIASYRGRYPAEEITVGTADESIVPYVEQHLKRCKVPVHHATGSPLDRSPVCRLLSAIRDYLDGESYRDLAALLRHPDLESWLLRGAGGTSPRETEDWLIALDEHARDHLQDTVPEVWPGNGRSTETLRAARKRVDELLSPLRDSSRPLSQWAAPIVAVLLEVHDRGPLDRNRPADRRILETFDQLHEMLEEMQGLEPGSAPELPATQALQLLLRRLARRTVPEPQRRESVELLGWLELLLDDAPALTVCGLNEEHVPQAVNADPFLPNHLRRHLGLLDNDRRYARDAYTLSAVLASREDVRIVLGALNAGSDPQRPSRLLFACEREILADRVRQLLAESPGRPPATGRLRPGLAEHAFEIPVPECGEPIPSMRVTSFRDYLACPYGFYLRHVLRLEPLDDRSEELDPLQFGRLAHEILKDFGKGPLGEASDPEEIAAHLGNLLDERVRKWYGESVRPAVLVQVEQLRRRLQAFAEWQADRTLKGWRMEHVELAVGKERKAHLEVDGEGMELRGRIDRIDVHESTGERVIFDYKTSESTASPDKTHRKRSGEWIDLQLPLYRHLAQAHGVDGPVTMGYIVLPGDPDDVGERMASWSQEDLEAAEERVRWVVRQVRQGVFWPPTLPMPRTFKNYEWIYRQDQIVGGSPAAESGEPE